jgi:L-fuculose-phosphate aldolase
MADIRARMIATCRQMNAAGLNQGTSGNLSARQGDGFLITPSSQPYDAMAPGDLVAMAFDGSHRGGRPSSEWRFHRDILAARPEVGCVLHCHAVHATAIACQLQPIPAFHYMVAVAGGHDIRCAPYATFGSAALSQAAVAALEGRMACLLGQHGMIALGDTPEAALALAVEVEVLARMYLAARVLGEPPVLPEAEMDRVLEQFRRMRYGLPPDARD